MKMDARRNFYLIFKEAINNIAKYSGAANAFVVLLQKENNLKMTIRGDGKIILGEGNLACSIGSIVLLLLNRQGYE
jgi:signal transduction histidine kinase